MTDREKLMALKAQVREFFAAARREGLWVGAGIDGNRPLDDEHQYGPMAKALLLSVNRGEDGDW